jgi:hypothetical protein
MSTTIDQQRALERYARQHERHLKFLRHSPREQRWLPFVEERDMPEFKDAVIGTLVFAAFVGTLIFLTLMLGGAP